jgi:hypothetical protein
MCENTLLMGRVGRCTLTESMQRLCLQNSKRGRLDMVPCRGFHGGVLVSAPLSPADFPVQDLCQVHRLCYCLKIISTAHTRRTDACVDDQSHKAKPSAKPFLCAAVRAVA